MVSDLRNITRKDSIYLSNFNTVNGRMRFWVYVQSKPVPLFIRNIEIGSYVIFDNVPFSIFTAERIDDRLAIFYLIFGADDVN